MNNIENLLNIQNIKNKRSDINYSKALNKCELSICIDKQIYM